VNRRQLEQNNLGPVNATIDSLFSRAILVNAGKKKKA
jgi:hypothetical protein